MADSVVDCDAWQQECRALVARILASKEFQRANRLRDFLLYVVDRKFADAPHEVSESLIGHRVFRRPAAYNTGEDSIVRTEARVLRQRLERYFAGEGIHEPIFLEIPKGSYLPVFAVARNPPWKPFPSFPSRSKSQVAKLPSGLLSALAPRSLACWHRAFPPRDLITFRPSGQLLVESER